MPLRRRKFAADWRTRKQHPAAKAFLAPQRDRAPKVQHPKPC